MLRRFSSNNGFSRRRSSLIDMMSGGLTREGQMAVHELNKDLNSILQDLEDMGLVMASGPMGEEALTTNAKVSDAYELMNQASVLLSKAQRLLQSAR